MQLGPPTVLSIASSLTVAALAITPAGVSADHCGAVGTVSPPSGPIGTTFVFSTNLGTPSDLHLFRNGVQVKQVFLAGDGDVRYIIRTRSGDAGRWRARAEARGRPDCASDAVFAVTGTPDTSTAAVPPRPQTPVIPAVAGALTLLAAARRVRSRTRPLAETLRVGEWHIRRAPEIVVDDHPETIRFADTIFVAAGECGYSGTIRFGSGGALTITEVGWDTAGCRGADDSRPALERLLQAVTTGRLGPDRTVTLSGAHGDVILGR